MRRLSPLALPASLAAATIALLTLAPWLLGAARAAPARQAESAAGYPYAGAGPARSAQAALALKFNVDNVFPKIDELPEEISSEELQFTYGGVGGSGYEAKMDEIKRRIDALPKL